MNLPSYPMRKQSKVILACMALHNFIRESAMRDADFDMCDSDENYGHVWCPVITRHANCGAATEVVVWWRAIWAPHLWPNPTHRNQTLARPLD